MISLYFCFFFTITFLLCSLCNRDEIEESPIERKEIKTKRIKRECLRGWSSCSAIASAVGFYFLWLFMKILVHDADHLGKNVVDDQFQFHWITILFLVLLLLTCHFFFDFRDEDFCESSFAAFFGLLAAFVLFWAWCVGYHMHNAVVETGSNEANFYFGLVLAGVLVCAACLVGSNMRNARVKAAGLRIERKTSRN